MSPDFRDIDAVGRITVGTVGEIGRRTFLMQVRSGLGEVVTVKLEKQQVAALAEMLGEMLSELPRPGHLPDDLALEEPADPDWVVGTIGLHYDRDADKILLLVEEIASDDSEGGFTAGSLGGLGPRNTAGSLGGLGPRNTAGSLGGLGPRNGVRVMCTREQAAALAIHGAQLVAAGRSPCPICGFPLDPAGHNCPRTNGHAPPTP